MSYGVRKYLETQEQFKGEFVYSRPQWTFGQNTVTVDENKNENRVFIWIHLIQINVRASFNACSFTFTPSGDVMTFFTAASSSCDGIFPFDMLVQGTQLSIAQSNGGTNLGILWQSITVDQDKKKK